MFFLGHSVLCQTLQTSQNGRDIIQVMLWTDNIKQMIIGLN